MLQLYKSLVRQEYCVLSGHSVAGKTLSWKRTTFPGWKYHRLEGIAKVGKAKFRLSTKRGVDGGRYDSAV